MTSLTSVELGAAFATLTLGTVLQGSVGFGFALITAPILALINPRLVPGPVLAAVLFLSLMVLGWERRSTDLAGLKWILIGYLPGALLGAATLATVPEKDINLVFSLLVLSAIFLSVVGLRLRLCGRTLFSAGFLAGFMGTASSINGPLVALVYQDSSGARLRGTLSGYFIVSNLVSLVMLGSLGLFGANELQSTLILLPAVVIGFLSSRRTAPLLDRGYTRPLVLVVSAGAALSLILQRCL